jgi:hypothetical protein
MEKRLNSEKLKVAQFFYYNALMVNMDEIK